MRDLASPARHFRSRLFPYEPRFAAVEIAGATRQMAYVEAGSPAEAPVLLLHGNPTWSFLYREVIPGLAGHRAIAPDFLGFGRSDKLPRFEDYTLDNHVCALAQLIDQLALTGITLVVHDWAGPIGLAFAVDRPDLIDRLVIMNTWAFAPQRHNRVPEPLRTFRKRPHGELLVLGVNAFVNVALPFGVVRRRRRMTREVMSAYRAPFPTWRSRWPVLAFPRQIPLRPGDAAHDRMCAVEKGLAHLKQPALLMWGGKDPVFPPRVARKFRERLGSVTHEIVFADASHFLQEDKPVEIAAAIASFVGGSPRCEGPPGSR